MNLQVATMRRCVSLTSGREGLEVIFYIDDAARLQIDQLGWTKEALGGEAQLDPLYAWFKLYNKGFVPASWDRP